MPRWLILFAVLLAIGSLLWPWLRELGLAHLPGDVVLDWRGYRAQLPIATALIISSIVETVWRLLDRG
jgi:uncharacterized membrane-anchored protein